MVFVSCVCLIEGIIFALEEAAAKGGGEGGAVAGGSLYTSCQESTANPPGVGRDEGDVEEEGGLI